MKINDEQYFTAGEFAKIVGVNKQTILYYDKIGLLPPAYKDDKNRRFYQVQHQEIFYLIEILQEMEMTLKEIKAFLEQRTPEEYVAKLKAQHLSVQEKIKHLQYAEKFIKDQIQVEQEKKYIAPDTIEVVKNIKFDLLCTEEIQKFSSFEKSQKLAYLMAQLQVNGANIGHAIGAILLKPYFLTKQYANYSYYCIFDDDMSVEYKQVETLCVQGDFLLAYHRGNIQTIKDTYEQLVQFVEDNQLNIGNNIIEKCIYGFVHEKDANEHLTAIYLQIEQES